MLLKQLLLTFTISIGLASSACFDNGDKEIQGGCYKFVPQKLTWDDARNWCHYQNPVTASYLAYVPNQFTSNFLASYARSAFGTDDGNFWIGLSRSSNGSWTWDNGFPVGWTNFGPQNGQNYAAESIVNAKWNAYGSSDKYFFVCSYDPAAPPTFPPPQSTTTSSPVAVSTQAVPTTTVQPAACVPSRNITVLYAYSTDIDYYTYNWGVYHMVFYADAYTTMANVRFDTKQEEEIEYHSDKNSLKDSLNSHKPDPSLGYGDWTTGSNLYTVLKKFLNNGNVSICGALVFIAVKRYPDESDVSDIISQLRANHVIVYIAVDSIPSGGSNSATLYEMSFETNGYCAFATGSDLSNAFELMTDILEQPYQFIAQNFVVSGSGRIEIPEFKTPIPVGNYDYLRFAITVQNHTLDNSFVSMSYTIESTDGTYVYKYPSHDAAPLYGTGQSDLLWCDGSLSYKWTIDYQYNTDAPQIIECRMYSYFYHDFVPLPDF